MMGELSKLMEILDGGFSGGTLSGKKQIIDSGILAKGNHKWNTRVLEGDAGNYCK